MRPARRGAAAFFGASAATGGGVGSGDRLLASDHQLVQPRGRRVRGAESRDDPERIASRAREPAPMRRWGLLCEPIAGPERRGGGGDEHVRARFPHRLSNRRGGCGDGFRTRDLGGHRGGGGGAGVFGGCVPESGDLGTHLFELDSTAAFGVGAKLGDFAGDPGGRFGSRALGLLDERRFGGGARLGRRLFL